jgi:hypothetical protein
VDEHIAKQSDQTFRTAEARLPGGTLLEADVLAERPADADGVASRVVRNRVQGYSRAARSAMEGFPRQAIRFLAPLICIIAMLAHARGIWLR